MGFELTKQQQAVVDDRGGTCLLYTSGAPQAVPQRASRSAAAAGASFFMAKRPF